MGDFWRASGFHLLARRAAGGLPRLQLTDEFLRAYLRRPEMRPVEESCAAERALHGALVKNPRQAVSPERLAGLADADARENYAVWMEFRDRLVRASSIEDAYLGLFAGKLPHIPTLFVDQLVHVILRNALDGCEDGMRLRAAELLFRSQKVTQRDGVMLCADEETVEMHAATGGLGSLGRLVVEAQTPMKSVDLDVLGADTAKLYFDRDDRYDTVIDLTFARPGLDAFARVLEAWVRHMLAVDVQIQPVQRIDDKRWVWHTGLDVDSSAILNDLYGGREVDEARLAHLVSLFRLEFRDHSVMRADIAGRPVYLGIAMSAANVLRVKPQNLLVNLPLAARA